MNVYIVEDNFFHLEDIKLTLETIGETCIGHSDDPFQVLLDINKIMPDVVLMDIHLNGKRQGVELAKKIKEDYQIPIIFTSLDKDEKTITEAASITPISYLSKPIREDNLKAALILSKNAEKPVDDNETLLVKEEQEVFVKQGNRLVKVKISDILYAFADTKNYCSIVVEDGNKYSIRTSISKLNSVLGAQDFVQTHRAYMVNLKRIREVVDQDQIIQIGDYQIPLGRSYKKELLKRLRIL